MPRPELLLAAKPHSNQDILVKAHFLKTPKLQVNALSFLPPQESRRDTCAIFTHGFTSSKSSIISWAQKLSEEGIPSLIFDLPDIFLGSYQPLSSFEDFIQEAPDLFDLGRQKLQEFTKLSFRKVVVGGHSLGALMSLKANLKQANVTRVLVGFGLNQSIGTHFFDTPLFKKTMNIRRQLVSKHLDSDQVFSWIKGEKKNLDSVQEQNIVLIAGEDDAVIGPKGADLLYESLKGKNAVELIKPKRLPHHQPELASRYILQVLRKEQE